MTEYMSYEDLPKLKLPYGQEVFISDSTLRDGAQMPSIVITIKNRLKIFEYLHKIGVEKLELFLFTDSVQHVPFLIIVPGRGNQKLRRRFTGEEIKEKILIIGCKKTMNRVQPLHGGVQPKGRRVCQV